MIGRPSARGDECRILTQYRERAGTDGAKARDADAQRFVGVAHADTCGVEACEEAEA